MRRIVGVGVVLILVMAGVPGLVVAEAPANDAFQRTWERTDQPVLSGGVSRTWMWGPEAFTDALAEPYTESPDGQRTVQYFDKARMEITTPDADPNSIWYVTNGLLVVELITGQMQTGNSAFTTRSSAIVNVAGDASDPDGPTYATFSSLLDASPSQPGDSVTSIVDRDANVSNDPSLSDQGVTIAIIDDVTNHAIAAPFWDFMNSTGTVLENGQLVQASLFENAYFATGRPITEPYWAQVEVGGTERLVLLQCFERRCLTYTPDNPEGWQVEAGNVGQHYHAWRYGDNGAGPAPPGEPDEDAIECLRVGFPCTLAETPSEAADRMFELGEELGDMLQAGASIDELVAHAESQPDVVETLFDEEALRFRVDGAPPAWVYDTDFVVDLIPEQDEARAPAALEKPELVRIEPSEVVGEDRDGDGMIDEEPKRALILSPYRWHFGSYDEGRGLRDLLNSARGYEGNVEYFENTKDEEGNLQAQVTLDMFGSWGAYDVVHVSTHGSEICNPLDGETALIACNSSISTGVEISRDDVPNTSVFGGQVSFNGDTGKVTLTADYFEWTYPTGLDNTIVFLSSCESFPVDYDHELVVSGDLPQTLAGLGGVVAGWDRSVLASSAQQYAMDIFQFAIEIGRPFGEIVDDYSMAAGPATYTNKNGNQVSPVLHSYAGGDDLRIREVVFQKHPLTDEEVEDGDALPIIGQFGDGEEDRLPFVVEVDGIVNNAAEFTVHVRINGEDRAETFSMADAEPISQNKYRLDEVDVPLGFDAQEDQPIELRMWVDLPEGGESKHTANVRLDNPILEFESVIETSAPGIDIRSEVHAEFTLIYNEDFTEIETGTTELEYMSYTIDVLDVPCEITTNTTDGTFEVYRTDFPTGQDGRISSLVPNEIVLGPHPDIYATATAHCPQGSITLFDQDIHWWAGWVVMHGGDGESVPGGQNEFNSEYGGWTIENWQEKPIQKIYDQRVVDEEVILDEMTTIKITMPDE